ELSSSYTISANRSILLDSGTLTVNGGLSALTNSGTFNWLTGSTDNLYEGGLTNNGVMTLNGSGTLDLDGLINSNSGTIAINSHVTMELGALGTFTNTEFISIAAGQTLDVYGALFLNGLGATISAVGGVFDAVGALFTNLGTLLGGNSPGYAYIMGNMALGDTSQLIAELGDTAPGLGGYDVYDVSGSLDLGGTLSVVEYGSFSVGAGDRFTVVTAGTLGHSFDSIDGLEIGHGVVLDVEQTGFDLTLVGHAVTHQGSASADTLTGGSSADAMVGGDGADLLIGGGGADILFGGLGDDIFRIADAAFSRIDGGAGVDTLQLAFGTFDMRAYRFDQVNDMEAIDLTGTGTLVTVNADIVRAMTSGTNALTNSSHALVITGDSGDVADIGSGWTNTGTTTIAGEGYAIYDHANGAQLAIHQNLGVAAA
ncbi:MAG: calcium-binding protein, partial [Alphaproteobacteria bacterium]